MINLVGYAMMSANKNAIDDGHLLKARCGFCGKKFGSIEAAERCKNEHLNALIRKELHESIKMEVKNG